MNECYMNECYRKYALEFIKKGYSFEINDKFIEVIYNGKCVVKYCFADDKIVFFKNEWLPMSFVQKMTLAIHHYR